MMLSHLNCCHVSFDSLQLALLRVIAVTKSGFFNSAAPSIPRLVAIFLNSGSSNADRSPDSLRARVLVSAIYGSFLDLR
jgi:hypothetical protein